MKNPLTKLQEEWQQVGNDRDILDAMPESTLEQRKHKQRVLEATRKRSWGKPTDVPLAVESRVDINLELLVLENEAIIYANFSTNEAMERFISEASNYGDVERWDGHKASCQLEINPCYDFYEVARYLGRNGEVVEYREDGRTHLLD